MQINQQHCKKRLVCFIYRPPSANVAWINTFDMMIEKAVSENLDVIIMGEFNIDLTSVNQNQKWKHVIASHNLTQLVNQPTRVTERSSTLFTAITLTIFQM